MRYVLFAFMFLYNVSLYAQNGELMAVSFVDASSDDFSARGANKRAIPDYPDIYQSLIKVLLPLEGAEIKKMNGIISVENHADKGEYWVWTCPGDEQPMYIQINHRDYHPLVVKLADYNIITEPMSTYHVEVSVPSALLAEAERLYNNIKLNEALNAYKKIVLNDDIKTADKELAQKRIGLIPECMKINENATLFARRYIEMVRNKEASKDVLIENLENAIYWYKRLYEVSGINKARSMSNRFSEILEEKSGTTVVEGTINLMQKISFGVWNKKKHGEIKNITVEITNKMLRDEVRTQIINTDKNGFFTFEIKNGYHVGLTFKCIYDGIKYQSEEIELADDKHLNILLKSR